MSDFKLPDLPSDKDLGLTEEDLKDLEGEFQDDGPEMSAAEMAALFGEAPPPPAAKPPSSKGGAKSGAAAGAAAGAGAAKTDKAAARKAEKARKAAEKKAAKEKKAAEKQAAKDRKAAARKAGSTTPGGAPPKAKEASAEGPADAAPAAEKRTRPAEGPRARWQGPATLVALIALITAFSMRTGAPAPVPANAPDTEFSSARAMAILVELARAPHAPGSPEHARVRDLLIERLTDLGLEPEVQTTTSVIGGGSGARTATVRNIVARWPGTASTGALLVTAHYDGREHALAAGDDGSGIVTILEAVRTLQATGPLQNDLIVLFTDAEELGLLGARAFVDEHRWMADVRLALSFEMRGGAGRSVMFETGGENGWIVGALKAADRYPFANSMVEAAYRQMPNDTDFTPFREAGVQGLNFAAADRANVYHQPYDAAENLSESSIQHHGLHAVDMVRYLGDADLTGELKAPDVVYVTLPFLGLVVYDARLAVPIGLALAGLLGLGFVVARRAGATPTGMLVGTGLMILGTALSYGVGLLALERVKPFHAEFGSLHGSAFHSEGWYVLSLAAIVLLLVTTMHSIARRWLGNADLAFGALVLPVAAAATIGFVQPTAAMNLQIPVGAALLALIVSSLLGKRANGSAGWAVSIALMAVALPTLVFVTEMLWVLMSIQMAALLGAVMAVTAYLCLPALDHLQSPNKWWASAASFVLAAGFFGMGWLASGSNADRPAPTTLAYALDRTSGDAWWVTSTLSDSADAPARAWAVEKAGDTFESVQDLTDFGYNRREAPVTRARPVTAAEPTILVENDTTANGVRRVYLSIRSEIGAERLIFRPGPTTQIVSLNGKRLDNSADLTWVDHWGEPNPVVILELEMAPGQSIDLAVIEHLLRPDELLGAEPFQRSEEFSLDVTWESDRAMLRTVIQEETLGLGTGVMPTESAPAEDPTGLSDDVMGGSESLDVDSIAAADSLARPDTTLVAPMTTDSTAALPDTVPVDTVAVVTPVADTVSADSTSVPRPSGG